MPFVFSSRIIAKVYSCKHFVNNLKENKHFSAMTSPQHILKIEVGFSLEL